MRPRTKPVIAVSNAHYGNTWRRQMVGAFDTAAKEAQRAEIVLLAETLIEEIVAWQQDRNANHANANWHFATANTRIKLKHQYLHSD